MTAEFRTYHKRIENDPAVIAAAAAEGLDAAALGAVIRSIPGEELLGMADDITTAENDGRGIRDWMKARPNLSSYDAATVRGILRYVAAVAPTYFPDRSAPVVEA
jgi:hypothetical protein